VLGKTRHIHFIGIGGIGMSGIAELLANLGYVVSGSDEKRSAVTDRLSELGIRVAYGHDSTNVGSADVVVTSSAVRLTNVEVQEASRRRILPGQRGFLTTLQRRLDRGSDPGGKCIPGQNSIRGPDRKAGGYIDAHGIRDHGNIDESTQSHLFAPSITQCRPWRCL